MQFQCVHFTYRMHRGAWLCYWLSRGVGYNTRLCAAQCSFIWVNSVIFDFIIHANMMTSSFFLNTMGKVSLFSPCLWFEDKIPCWLIQISSFLADLGANVAYNWHKKCFFVSSLGNLNEKCSILPNKEEFSTQIHCESWKNQL